MLSFAEYLMQQRAVHHHHHSRKLGESQSRQSVGQITAELGMESSHQSLKWDEGEYNLKKKVSKTVINRAKNSRKSSCSKKNFESGNGVSFEAKKKENKAVNE